MVKRLVALVALTGGMVAVLAGPAFAHGGGGADATNFKSVVNRVVQGDADDADAAPVELDGVTWSVRALDSYLEVSNQSGEELLVFGYEGEPYLRIGPDGVLENQNSASVYLNNDRFAETPVPEGVGPESEPEWVEVATEPVYRWHDHRIHWMAQTDPPQVKTDPTAVQLIQDWAVPFTLAGEEFGVQGQLRWFPPPPPWPWLGAAFLTAVIVLGAAFAKARNIGSHTVLIRTGAVIVAVVVAVDVVHAIDDVLAVPATVGENSFALVQSLLFVAMGAFGAVRGWRGGDGAPVALALGAFALMLGIGATHLASLTSSQIASTLPAAFTRAVVALNLAALPPVVLAVAYVMRRQSADEDQEAPVGIASEAATS